MQADVSVIIPTWNRAHDIGAAIKSVLDQTFSPCEILVCDDGSTDDTSVVVSSFGSPIVNFLPGSHVGNPAAPRNRGIEVAKGGWLAFLDSDDTWKNDKLERQFGEITLNGCLACSTNASLKNVQSENLLIDNDFVLKTIDFSALINGNQIVCSSVVVKKDLVLSAGKFPSAMEYKGIEDFALWLRLALLTDFAYISEPLVVYNDDINQSTARNKDQNAWQQMYLVIEHALKWDGLRGLGKLRYGLQYAKLLRRKMIIEKELEKYANSSHR